MFTLIVVLAVGYVTLVRIVSRNLASDRYKRALNRIRRHFLAGRDDSRTVCLAFDPFKLETRAQPSWRSIGRGGWLETVALVESFVAGAVAASVTPTPSWWSDGVVAAIAGFGVWMLLMWDARRRYDSYRIKPPKPC